MIVNHSITCPFMMCEHNQSNVINVPGLCQCRDSGGIVLSLVDMHELADENLSDPYEVQEFLEENKLEQTLKCSNFKYDDSKLIEPERGV